MNKKVRVRGNIVSDVSGKGLESICIEVIGDRQEDSRQFHTSNYGLFLFELDNSKSYKISIKESGYFGEEFVIPKGLRSIYFPVLLKPKK